ncbi:hypothetical protein [Mesomycoplasma hyorhinis]|nr:hypothetical protein [Mesomycoplasma hyorhinis]
MELLVISFSWSCLVGRKISAKLVGCFLSATSILVILYWSVFDKLSKRKV